MRIRACPLTLALAMAVGCASAFAQNVKITPLGSHAGELCSRDRATRPATIRTLRGAASQIATADSRLQKIAIQKANV